MITLEHITKRFGASTVVDDLSLTVAAGELLVLLGGSGCGKTTTLKMINRLIEPTSGRILLDGQAIHEQPAYALRRHVGYVFQKIGLFPHMTVAENIAITPRLLGWDTPRIDRRIEELLRMVDLDPAFAARWPTALSGGQQQRVGVARALAAAPKVMLLDEPFGALDPLTRDRLQQALLRIQRTQGLTAIFVTHDMLEALLLGDRIAVMEEGRLVQIGTPYELMHAPATPYVRDLLETPQRQAQRVEDLMDMARSNDPAPQEQR